MTNYRIETDSLGEVKVPASAYYGAQTQRAVESFPIRVHSRINSHFGSRIYSIIPRRKDFMRFN